MTQKYFVIDVFRKVIFFWVIVFSVQTLGFSQCLFEKAPPGEICSTALPISGVELNGYTSMLPLRYSQTQIQENGNNWGGLCNGNGSAQNIIWFSFIPCSSTVELEITVGTCFVLDTMTGANMGSHPNAGLQVGLFKGCTVSEYVDCSMSPTSGSGMTGTFVVRGTTFVPGEPAYLYLDGFNVNLKTITVCDFSIKVLKGIDTTPVQAPDPTSLQKGDITGPNTVNCSDLDKPMTYNLTPPECAYAYNPGCGPSVDFNPKDSACYVWQVSPMAGRSFVNQDSVGVSADIRFSKPGVYTISADVYLNPAYGTTNANAACGNIRTWTVTVLEADSITATPIIVCPGQTFDYCGISVSKDTIIYCASGNCQITKQEFVFSTSQVQDHGTIYVCPADTYTFQNNTFRNAGHYDVVDQFDCTLLHKFDLVWLDIKSSISATQDLLTCKELNSTITASLTASLPGNTQFTWSDPFGNIIGNAQSISVSQPGTYKIDFSFELQNAKCTATEYYSITQDITAPDANLNIPTLKCRNSRYADTIITAIPVTNLADAYWTTPSGVKVAGLNIAIDSIQVMSGNPYILTLTGTNGCIATKEVLIPYNLKKVNLTIQGDDILTCYNPYVNNMKVTVDAPVLDVKWYRIENNTLPPVFIINGPSIFSLPNNVHSKPGRYGAEVIAADSYCTSDIYKDVTEDKISPTVDLGPDQMWYCNTSSISLDAQVTSNNSVNYFWSTINGSLSASDIKNPNVLAPGEYVLSVLNTVNGCAKTDKINIIKETNVPTSIDIASEDVSCYGENNGYIHIDNINGGFEPYTIKLNGNIVNNIDIQNLSEGDYEIDVVDIHGCELRVQTTISEPQPFEIDLPNELQIAFNESIGLSFTSNYTDIESVEWVNGRGEIISRDFSFDYNSLESDVITLVATSSKGCESRAKITISVDNELKLYFPNIFTPNGDGINDKFIVWKNKIPAVLDEMCIYDRMGNIVYNEKNIDFNDPDSGWDGYFRGQKVESGTYVYICKFTDYKGLQNTVKGDITVLDK
ncbi:MAG: gliding motility-associated C-terminal domain-containing protein [Lewinellaceae bacterium]|nr:gliding motility-associated C-terminal domain-containing protein [Lewinellaceae bacterium]